LLCRPFSLSLEQPNSCSLPLLTGSMLHIHGVDNNVGSVLFRPLTSARCSALFEFLITFVRRFAHTPHFPLAASLPFLLKEDTVIPLSFLTRPPFFPDPCFDLFTSPPSASFNRAYHPFEVPNANALAVPFPTSCPLPLTTHAVIQGQ